MMRTAVFLMCAACGSVEGEQRHAAVIGDMAVDTPSVDAPQGPPCDVTKPFGTPQLVPGVNKQRR